MFRHFTLAATFVCFVAAPALAQPTEFYPEWSARDKFAWAAYNYEEFCSIPPSRDVQFEDLPKWMRAGMAMATEDMMIGGIMKSCGKDLTAETAAAYNRQ